MDYFSNFYDALKQTDKIALATSVNNIPNVRIVNFVYDVIRPEILYFASDRENQKVIEFSQNSQIAFTTVPAEGITHLRSNNAVVAKSKFTIDDMKELFISRIPGYDETIEAIGATLDVFEIHIKEAMIISGFGEPKTVSF